MICRRFHDLQRPGVHALSSLGTRPFSGPPSRQIPLGIHGCELLRLRRSSTARSSALSGDLRRAGIHHACSHHKCTHATSRPETALGAHGARALVVRDVRYKPSDHLVGHGRLSNATPRTHLHCIHILRALPTASDQAGTRIGTTLRSVEHRRQRSTA